MALAPIHLRSLFCRMDECIRTIGKFAKSYHLVTDADIAFFFYKPSYGSWNAVPKTYRISGVEMVEVEENGQVVKRPNRPYQPRAQGWLSLKQNKN